ncbi:DUF2270 domain-containing protein [Methylobacterium nigriterrae]|uniref:DUF2270 domain-containing protein n=1 Tax=Methylobacterium nigriterrae TaxID=3127512 RepID=UPI0030140ABA
MSVDHLPHVSQDAGTGSRQLPLPSSSVEVGTAVAHYYRAEMGRATGWRDRIDRTTNWAITVIAAMLSVSLSTPSAHHGVLLFAMLIVMLLLAIEARRYRFFDVYRVRLRLLERNYFAQVLAPKPDSGSEWACGLADDLRQPVFLITSMEAISRRLRRNYCWMFLILLLAWVFKIASFKLQIDGGSSKLVPFLTESLSNAAVGSVPGWVVLAFVVTLYGWLLYATLRPSMWDRKRDDGRVHV